MMYFYGFRGVRKPFPFPLMEVLVHMLSASRLYVCDFAPRWPNPQPTRAKQQSLDLSPNSTQSLVILKSFVKPVASA